MKIIWKRGSPGKNISCQNPTLGAYIEGLYFENREVKENTEKHLGTIDMRFLNINESGMREFHRGLFWATVDKNLDHLKLSQDQRKKIESEIVDTIPRPADSWSLWAVKCVPKYDQ
ncbi:hypothetical protein ACFL9T_02185 [Thermodesulfobacteriota bacterium]